MLLLDAVIGSHLYGLAHSESDIDRYRVLTTGHPTKHRYSKSGDDVIKASLSAFAKKAWDGSHQALDAMFSPDEFVSCDVLRAYRKQFKAGREAYKAILRASKGFILTHTGDSYDHRKRRRHGVRLLYCLEDLQATGQYNPRLSKDRLAVVHPVIDYTYSDTLSLARRINPYIFLDVK